MEIPKERNLLKKESLNTTSAVVKTLSQLIKAKAMFPTGEYDPTPPVNRTEAEEIVHQEYILAYNLLSKSKEQILALPDSCPIKDDLTYLQNTPANLLFGISALQDPSFTEKSHNFAPLVNNIKTFLASEGYIFILQPGDIVFLGKKVDEKAVNYSNNRKLVVADPIFYSSLNPIEAMSQLEEIMRGTPTFLLGGIHSKDSSTTIVFTKPIYFDVWIREFSQLELDVKIAHELDHDYWSLLEEKEMLKKESVGKPESIPPWVKEITALCAELDVPTSDYDFWETIIYNWILYAKEILPIATLLEGKGIEFLNPNARSRIELLQSLIEKLNIPAGKILSSFEKGNETIVTDFILLFPDSDSLRKFLQSTRENIYQRFFDIIPNKIGVKTT